MKIIKIKLQTLTRQALFYNFHIVSKLLQNLYFRNVLLENKIKSIFATHTTIYQIKLHYLQITHQEVITKNN